MYSDVTSKNITINFSTLIISHVYSNSEKRLRKLTLKYPHYFSFLIEVNVNKQYENKQEGMQRTNNGFLLSTAI